MYLMVTPMLEHGPRLVRSCMAMKSEDAVLRQTASCGATTDGLLPAFAVYAQLFKL
jgi:hypothetical protein